MGKAVDSVLEIKLKFLVKIVDSSYSEQWSTNILHAYVHNSLKGENKVKEDHHPVVVGY